MARNKNKQIESKRNSGDVESWLQFANDGYDPNIVFWIRVN